MTTQRSGTPHVRVFGLGAIAAAFYFVAVLHANSAPHPSAMPHSGIGSLTLWLPAIAACGLLKHLALRWAGGGTSGHWLLVAVNALGAPVVGATSAMFYWSVLLPRYS